MEAVIHKVYKIEENFDKPLDSDYFEKNYNLYYEKTDENIKYLGKLYDYVKTAILHKKYYDYNKIAKDFCVKSVRPIGFYSNSMEFCSDDGIKINIPANKIKSKYTYYKDIEILVLKTEEIWILQDANNIHDYLSDKYNFKKCSFVKLDDYDLKKFNELDNNIILNDDDLFYIEIN